MKCTDDGTYVCDMYVSTNTVLNERSEEGTVVFEGNIGHLRRMYSTDKLYHIKFLSTPHLKTADLIIYVSHRC
jgi:hypothetical protein